MRRAIACHARLRTHLKLSRHAPKIFQPSLTFDPSFSGLVQTSNLSFAEPDTSCNFPTCNQCAVFEEDEEVKGWRAGISVGYCNGCDMNLGEMAISEKLCGTEASTMNSLNGETRKSLTPSSESVAIKFYSLSLVTLAT